MDARRAEALCTRCGLCCDGSLFADVELGRREDSTSLVALGLDVEEDDDREGAEVLLQPCAALQERRCGVYPHRPGCCRTFECRVLQEHRLGMIGATAAAARVDEALRRIGAVRAQLRQLGPVDPRLPLAEQVAEALAPTEDGGSPKPTRGRQVLEAEWTPLRRWLRSTFLGNGRRKVGNSPKGPSTQGPLGSGRG